MPPKRGGFTQSETAKGKIGSAAKDQWKDPKVRAKRQKAMKEAWAKKKSMTGICTHCGQPLPEESGRD